MTPPNVARFMASLFPRASLDTCRLLDAGAGFGSDAPSHLIHFNGERFLGPYVLEPGDAK
jgi:hypothetical protein